MQKLKRINARIDSALESLVQELAHIQGVSASAIVVQALRAFCQTQLPKRKSSPYEAFSKAGLIGCMKSGKNLSRNYKKELSEILDKKYQKT